MSLHLATNHQCDRNRFIIRISKYADDQSLLTILYSTASSDFHPDIDFNSQNRDFIISNELADMIFSKQVITKLEKELTAIEHSVLFDEKSILDIESDAEFKEYIINSTSSDTYQEVVIAMIYSCLNGMYVIAYRTMVIDEDDNSHITEGVSPMIDSHLAFRFLRRIKMKLS